MYFGYVSGHIWTHLGLGKRSLTPKIGGVGLPPTTTHHPSKKSTNSSILTSYSVIYLTTSYLCILSSVDPRG